MTKNPGGPGPQACILSQLWRPAGWNPGVGGATLSAKALGQTPSFPFRLRGNGAVMLAILRDPWCHRLNVCVPPRCLCQNPGVHCDGTLAGGNLGEWLGYEGPTLQGG